jgi:hypothetical protein
VGRRGKKERANLKERRGSARRRDGVTASTKQGEGNERMDKGPGNREYDGKNVSTEKGKRKVMREIK